ncbi:MAG: S-methyl-5'-thioinosine phosphorylase [Candidatus Nanopelagicales bacterium]
MPGSGSGALGIIAGTGFYALESLTDPREEVVDTAYGPARILAGGWHGRPAVFATRHGADHSVPPHLVNYRAIVTALAGAGVREILAVNVVGGIGHGPGDLVVVDDFLDFTKGRPGTFIDGTGPVEHVDVSQPYDERLRGVLVRAAEASGQPVAEHGVYACFEGPRFETRAEIRLARTAGATVVGMTGVPEVVLAREAGIPYASLCLVVNPAVGESGEAVTMAEIERVIADGRARVMAILDIAVRVLAAGRPS